MVKTGVVLAAAATVASAHLHEESYYQEKFFDWMQTHNVQFSNGAEFAQRLAIFASADDLINTHNEAGHSYTLGHNQYSHLSWEEFRSIKGLGLTAPKNFLRKGDAGNVHNVREGYEAPTSIDWVSKGAVTGVKDQGSCGSCWSFSTTGAIEGAYFRKTGSLVSFSEQQLVSCDNTDSGCNGGWMDNAFAWIKSNGGLCTEAAYPYTSASGTAASCKKTCSNVAAAAPVSYTDVTKTEAALQDAVALTPVSIAIEADQVGFQYYSGGVFTGTCGTNIDHGVLAVGYGTYTDGTPYWKVKNSWGTSWGQGGYILLQKGKSQAGGQCGITLAASYPNL